MAFGLGLEREDRLLRTEGRFPALFEPAPDGELVALDTETTSLDPRQAELVAIGAVRLRGTRILTSQRFAVTIKPRGPVSGESIRFHRLRPVDLAAGIEVETALQRLIDFVGGRPLVGYYLEFDLAVIDRALDRWQGVLLPNRRIEVSALYYDWKVARSQFLRTHGVVDLRFDAILADLGLPRLRKHDAVSDAVSAALMYLKLERLLARQRAARPGPLAALARLLPGWRRASGPPSCRRRR
jgi:DNA polymerase-3 subunit epsilon